MKYAAKTVITLLGAVALWFIWWLTLPTLSLGFIGGFGFIALVILAIVSDICMWASDSDCDRYIFIPIVVVVVVEIVALIIGVVISTTLFNASTMQKQIGEVEKVEYNEMIKQIDTAQIPIVDEELARKQADKKIGQDAALGSRVVLGDAAIQNVNGEILYVFPLEHTDFFKWNKHRSTPGYITVSASNPNKVEYVTKLGDESINIYYSQSSCFGNNLKRHIRNNGYTNMALTEYTFELNNEGRPYWVVTAYKNLTVWGNPEAQGVVVVDAQNGEVEYYSMQDAPDWIDIIQPSSFIENQIDNWGTLVHGVFNFADTDKIKKTDLLLTVYVDGHCYYFTGMTSVGADDSCVGFIMVNTRDKKPKMAYMAGANENAAMKSAEGLVSNYGYTSTEPLPLNVSGIPTYVMALKDAEGLIKNYAMVNIDNYSIAAKGATLLETSKNYLQAVTRNSTTYVVGSDEAYGYDVEGTIKRIANEVQEGSTQYFIVLEEEPEKIFTASYSVSEELAITQVGDKVKIYYLDSSNGTIDVMAFDNVAFEVTVSDDQQRRDELDEGTSALDSKYNQIYEVNPEVSKDFWDGLSEEEKAKLIEQYLGNE